MPFGSSLTKNLRLSVHVHKIGNGCAPFGVCLIPNGRIRYARSGAIWVPEQLQYFFHGWAMIPICRKSMEETDHSKSSLGASGNPLLYHQMGHKLI